MSRTGTTSATTAMILRGTLAVVGVVLLLLLPLVATVVVIMPHAAAPPAPPSGRSIGTSRALAGEGGREDGIGAAIVRQSASSSPAALARQAQDVDIDDDHGDASTADEGDAGSSNSTNTTATEGEGNATEAPQGGGSDGNTTTDGDATEAAQEDPLEGPEEDGNSTSTEGGDNTTNGNANATEPPPEGVGTDDDATEEGPDNDLSPPPNGDDGGTMLPDCEMTTRQDCDQTCGNGGGGAPYVYLLQEVDVDNDPAALVGTAYAGFRCQCRDPPLDCTYGYNFPTCVAVGVVGCGEEQEVPPDSSPATNVTTSGTANDGGAEDDAAAAVAARQSCADLCELLGFRRELDLCTRNSVADPPWTSCACEVDVGLGRDGGLSVTGGFFVCGDPGFEAGLVLVDAAVSVADRFGVPLFLAVMAASATLLG